MVKAATAQRYANTVDVLAADVGQRIRTARQERAMSLAQLGGEDLSRSFLSLVELGRSRISLRALAIVAERLELPISYFLNDTLGASNAAVELTLDYAEAALAQRKPQECLRMLDEIEIPDTLRHRALTLRGRALNALNRGSEALEPLREALAVVERRNDPHAKNEVRYALGAALYSVGQFDEALIQLYRIVNDAEPDLSDPVLLGKAAVVIGHIMYIRGDVDRAMEHYSHARDLFGSFGDLFTLGALYSGLSQTFKSKGDLSNALRYAKLSLGAFEAQQNVYGAANELNGIAVRYQQMGDLDQALSYAREAVTRALQIGATDIEALAHSTLASIYLEQNNFEEAALEAGAAAELAPSDIHPARIDAWVVLASLAEREGDQTQADDLYRRALTRLRDSDQNVHYADVALIYSLALRNRGETEAALEFALEAAQAKAARPA